MLHNKHLLPYKLWAKAIHIVIRHDTFVGFSFRFSNEMDNNATNDNEIDRECANKKSTERKKNILNAFGIWIQD